VGIPQIIYVGLTLAGLFLVANKHGQKRDGETYNFFTIAGTSAIIYIILIWGGFFG
jgi:hypothetical protein